MSKKQNLVTGSTESFVLNATYKDAAGNPVDLTGHSVDLVVQRTNGTAVGTYAASVDAEGNIAVAVDDAVTATWPVAKLAYFLVHEPPGGLKTWLAYGALTVVDGSSV